MREERDVVLAITARQEGQAQVFPDGERQYRTMDKRGWGTGPWQDEPDKIQWVDRATDLDCLVVRNHAGNWCGYVGLPVTHPWHGKGYGASVLDDQDGGDWENSIDAMVEVHGGLTYSAFCQEHGDEASAICHVAGPGRPEPVWWFGFDAGHSGDFSPQMHASLCGMGKTGGYFGEYRVGVPPYGEEYRTVAYVRGQVALLAAQLAAIADEGADGR